MRRPTADEFVPLPWYNWADSRPESVPFDIEEVATALFLANGDIHKAATLLCVTRARLQRVIRISPRLQRLQDELSAARASDDERPAATGS